MDYTNLPSQPLNYMFYCQPTIELARTLLGCLLINMSEEGTTSGIIVETEAYLGADDRAAHSYNNRRTNRTEIMFHEPGYIYTYTMHTHCLFNVVSAEIGSPEAVLIRALEPHSGIELMKKRRPVTNIQNLTNGPGKLTKAMGIKRDHYGETILQPPLFISAGQKPEHISTGKRIGIPNAKEATDYPYRFWITGNPFVSR